MAFAEVNGQRLYYEDTAKGRLPVVLSHGILMDHEMFAPQVAALRGAYRVITWDQRYHGQTVTRPGPFTYWDSASDLAGLLDRLGIQKAVIGGMSQGGFVALRFALRFPARCLGLILIDTQAGREDEEKVGMYRLIADVWAQSGLSDEMAEGIASIVLGANWEGRAPWIAKWQAIPGETIAEPFQALINREDLHQRLPEIAVPALVVHGEADVAIALAAAQRLRDGIGLGVGPVRVFEAGHASNLTHPNPVNRAIVDFLRHFPDTA